MRYWYLRLAVFLGALAVPAWWLYQAWIFALGPDPGKTLVDRLGLGALVLLLLTLAMTPLQKLSGWPGWIAVRRQLGLWCFTYVLLHLSAYCVFILGLDWGQLGIELSKRPYIIVGMLGFICLFLLAITSNRFAMRKLGSRWKKLHRLVYLILGLGLLHMLWWCGQTWRSGPCTLWLVRRSCCCGYPRSLAACPGFELVPVFRNKSFK